MSVSKYSYSEGGHVTSVSLLKHGWKAGKCVEEREEKESGLEKEEATGMDGEDGGREKMAPVSYGFDQLLRLCFSFSHTHARTLSLPFYDLLFEAQPQTDSATFSRRVT